jgi:hypothetical protein
MDREQLADELRLREVDPRAYDIYGRDDYPSETYVIRSRQSGAHGKPDYWVTYYSERGLESGIRKFDSEAEACQSFLGWVTSDGSIRPK